MTTKTYLQQVARLENMIQNKLSEIYKLKTMACSVTVSNESDRVQTSSDKDRLGSTVAKIVDLEEETDILVNDFLDIRKCIIRQIDSMEDNDFYNVLSLRYIGEKTFEEIAKSTNWSLRKVFMIHGQALQEFERLYGSEYLESVQ
jgi:DNA-directed RNA polymerase specialized sigma subunit